jgi:hypothetical protein
MQSGSLTIGGSNANYGGGWQWTGNTAGLMMKCLDNTEIAVHDGRKRLASLMYFQGGSGNNRITIGRDMGWGAISNVDINGNVNANSGILVINAADWGPNASKGLIFRSGYDVPNDNNYNCSVLTYDHNGGGFNNGLSINAWHGISFCTGSNRKAERMRISNGGRVGVANTNPQSMLHLGNCEVLNSVPCYCIWEKCIRYRL